MLITIPGLRKILFSLRAVQNPRENKARQIQSVCMTKGQRKSWRNRARERGVGIAKDGRITQGIICHYWAFTISLASLSDSKNHLLFINVVFSNMNLTAFLSTLPRTLQLSCYDFRAEPCSLFGFSTLLFERHACLLICLLTMVKSL